MTLGDFIKNVTTLVKHGRITPFHGRSLVQLKVHHHLCRCQHCLSAWIEIGPQLGHYGSFTADEIMEAECKQKGGRHVH